MKRRDSRPLTVDAFALLESYLDSFSVIRDPPTQCWCSSAVPPQDSAMGSCQFCSCFLFRDPEQNCLLRIPPHATVFPFQQGDRRGMPITGWEHPAPQVQGAHSPTFHESTGWSCASPCWTPSSALVDLHDPSTNPPEAQSKRHQAGGH